MPVRLARVWACCLTAALAAGCGSTSKPAPPQDGKTGELEPAPAGPKKGKGGVSPGVKEGIGPGKIE